MAVASVAAVEVVASAAQGHNAQHQQVHCPEKNEEYEGLAVEATVLKLKSDFTLLTRANYSLYQVDYQEDEDQQEPSPKDERPLPKRHGRL